MAIGYLRQFSLPGVGRFRNLKDWMRQDGNLVVNASTWLIICRSIEEWTGKGSPLLLTSFVALSRKPRFLAR